MSKCHSPPELFLGAGRLTDNGILLLHGNSANPVSYAIYQLRLIPLSEFGIGVADVNELATLVGTDASRRPVIRYLDGRTVIPWSGDGVVTAVGANGHYAGQSSYNVFWYGRPGEAASRLALGGRLVSPMRINRSGVVAGDYVPNGIGDRYAFIYQDGSFHNVNSLVSALVYFRLVVALTDQGVLAVHGGPFPAPAPEACLPRVC